MKTISSLLVQHVAQRLADCGVDGDAFAARTGITPDALAAGVTRYSAAQYAPAVQLWGQAMAEGAPGMVPTPTMETLLQRMPLPGALWCNAPNAGAALHDFLRMRALLGEFDTLHVVVAAPQRLELAYESDWPGMAGIASAIGNFMILRAIAEHYGAACELTLPRSAPAQLALQCDARLGSSARFVVAGAALARAAQPHHALLYRHARGQCEAALAALPRALTLTARVSRLIEAAWNEGHDDGALLQHAAAALHLSRWSLRRRLEAEGTSFQALVDALRARLAQQLLGGSELSLLEVGLRLGFASQSSFSRWHRERFGVSPRRMRPAPAGAKPAPAGQVPASTAA